MTAAQAGGTLGRQVNVGWLIEICAKLSDVVKGERCITTNVTYMLRRCHILVENNTQITDMGRRNDIGVAYANWKEFVCCNESRCQVKNFSLAIVEH